MRSATDYLHRTYLAVGVSIHALLAECDIPASLAPILFFSFNPRTPCGVRPKQDGRLNPDFTFQSTHSLRSATKTAPNLMLSVPFQSTHSLRSATLSACICLMYSAVSIHALLAECDAWSLSHASMVQVSIHALLAECDLKTSPGFPNPVWFQSTHSLRSATVRISASIRGIEFQSTHSLRSATLSFVPSLSMR